MTPDERKDLIDEISKKLEELDDLELMRIATQHDIHVESAAEKMTKDGPITIPPLIDTSMLTGPIDSLKNFLVKKTRDADADTK